MSHPTQHGNGSDPLDEMDDLSALYGASREESPAISPATDQAILAAAKRELGTGPQRPTSADKRIRRWSVPFAGAALILLSTTLFMTTQDQFQGPLPVFAPESARESAPELPAQSKAPPTPAVTTSPQQRTESLMDLAPMAEMEATPQLSESPSELSSELPIELQQADTPQAMVRQQRSSLSAKQPERDRAATLLSKEKKQAQQYQSETNERAATLMDSVQSTSVPQAGTLATPAASLQAESLSQLTADQWLAQIKAQLEAGEITQVRKELERWRQSHPEHPVPDWAKALLSPADQGDASE
ncbi:hypothetical protein [Motiliproteus sp.]|uniref:hypothetical protein n=1 Tax=Motiliproteus sp. TaxID=1898955 RepID=UPI003BA85368